MASRQSNLVELGSDAIEFELFEPYTNQKLALKSQYKSKATLILFMCNHCPYVIHIIDSLSLFAKDYMQKGLSIFAINPNDPKQYPDDSPEKMIGFVKKHNITFPYLFDETQEIALAYNAQCTPEFFLYDNELKLRYHGQFDGARPGNGIEVSGIDLKEAVNSVLTGNTLSIEQKSCVGCSIKWK